MKSKRQTSKVHEEILPPYVVLIDTETVPANDNYQQLLLACFEVWEVSIRTGVPIASRSVGRQPLPFQRGILNSEDQFYELIKSLGSCRVVAHNWEYDAAVLRLGSKSTTRRHGYSLDVSTGIYPVGGKGYSPFWVCLRWNDDPLRVTDFVCNTNYHKCSLKSLGKSFGIEKLDLPPLPRSLLDVRLPPSTMLSLRRMDANAAGHLTTGNDAMDHLIKVIQYCKRDVEILREAWFSLYRFTQRVAKTTPGITVAQAAMRCFKRRWLPKPHNGFRVVGSMEYPNVSEKEQEAYHGGRVDVFWQGKPDCPLLNKYDANSMYPSAMLGAIPVEWDGMASCPQLMRSLDDYGDGEQAPHIHLAEVTVDIPPEGVGWLGWEGVFLPDVGLAFPAGRFRTWTWQPMLNVARQKDWIADVHAVLRYRAFPLFKQYVEDIYALRREAKENGDGATALLYKYLLNSLYGKFGQGQFGEWERLEDGDPDLAWQMDNRPPDVARWSGFPDGDTDAGIREYWETAKGIHRFKEAEPGMGKNSVCSIAGYITCLARTRLWRVMASLMEAGSQVFMCDTDSVITDGELNGAMVGDALGQWKLEKQSSGTAAEFLAPKHYTFANETKCKGVREPVEGQFTYEQAQFSRWRTDLLSKSEARAARLERGAMITPIGKTVTGINRKRVCHGSGRTDPIVIDSEGVTHTQ